MTAPGASLLVPKLFRKDGTLVLLSDVRAQPLIALGRSELLDEIGEEYVCGDIDEALAAARKHLGLREEGAGS